MTTPKKTNKDGSIAQQTIGRRTVLEWFGKATMISLASPIITACLEGGGYDDDSDGFDSGDTLLRADTDADSATDTSKGGFAFSPGEGHELLDEFVIFTVDEQDVANTIANWSLTVDGLVETPVTLSFADLLKMTTQKQKTDFHCVTGWSVYDVPWVGVSIKSLLDLVTPLKSATHVTYHCQGDIYTESSTLDEALEPKSMMAYGVGDSTLPLDHGFPLRLIMPRKLGYKNAKYIYRIELTDAQHLGYWENLGYPYAADVPESRLREGKY
ncbi:MAG: molybdopterin-dependent oxidoreductase [Deltaproteobacteria bacterium]|nr:molybdopterin-dependent oxidoreductase [Deltaproteobacteria bacterium]